LAIVLAAPVALPVPAAAWHPGGELGAYGDILVCPGIFPELPPDVKENIFACPGMAVESPDKANEPHTPLDDQVLQFWDGCAARKLDVDVCVTEYKQARQAAESRMSENERAGLPSVISETFLRSMLSWGEYCRDQRAKHAADGRPMDFGCMTDKEFMQAGIDPRKFKEIVSEIESQKRQRMATPCAALPKGAVKDGDRSPDCATQVNPPIHANGEKY
jgi:hypothetical protein